MCNIHVGVIQCALVYSYTYDAVVCTVCCHVYSCIVSFRIHFKLHGVKLLQIASFRDFRFFFFPVCDVTAHPLLVWSKFSWDETFMDGY